MQLSAIALSIARAGYAAADPLALFTAGEQGIWLDPSDFSTLFQDAAGTTPVTAVGQPVGKILDKSGRGNHATQTTSASRPTVEARVNLLTKTDAGFSEVQWQGVGTTASGSRITATAVNSNHIRYQTYTHVPNVPVRYRVQVAKKIGFGFFQLCHTNPNRVKCTVNLETGEFVVSKLGGADAVVTVTDTGTGRWEVTITGSNPAAAATGYFNMGPATSLSDAVGTHQEPVFTGTGEYIDVYEPDLRLASDASYPYQRVNTATDYVDVGAPRYLQFDGTDDGMATPSIDFTGTDKMTVWTGAKASSAAANAMLFELSTAFGAGNPGSMGILWPRLPYAVNFGLAGTGAASRSISAVADTVLRVISCAFDISSALTVDEITPRVNGAGPSLLTIDAGPAGTGNFGNYPLYIGRRGSTSLPFNGRLYGLIVRGAASSDGQIAATEAWCNSKTRAY